MYDYRIPYGMGSAPCACRSSCGIAGLEQARAHHQYVWNYSQYDPRWQYPWNYRDQFLSGYVNRSDQIVPQEVDCFSNSDCSPGEICNGTRCGVPECKGDVDCAKFGKFCGNGRCLSLACNPAAPCPEGYKCNIQYSMCVPAYCNHDEQCPVGMKCDGMGNCIPIEYNPYCYGTCGCQAARDCPLGYSCITNLCVPWGCKSDEECDLIRRGTTCIEGSCVTPPDCGDVDRKGCINSEQCDVSGVDTASQHMIVIQNNSSKDIYVGSFGQVLDPITQAPQRFFMPNDGGWLLRSGEKSTVAVPIGWQGRFWGRTDCVFDASERGRCATGDCGGRLRCNGLTGEAGATLVEFNFDSNPGGTIPYPMDVYDISLVDGLNLMVEIRPIDGTIDKGANKNPDRFWCTPIGCNSKMLNCCPEELKKKVDGVTKSCLTACTKTQNPMYCCPMQTWDPIQGKLVNSIWGSPANCIPSKWDVNYTAFFKNRCPDQYSFAYDDTTSTNTCTSAMASGRLSAYCVSFCDA